MPNSLPDEKTKEEDSEKKELSGESIKAAANLLKVDVEQLLKGFNNQAPSPSKKEKIPTSKWEKIVIYMPFILITLPIITTSISALGSFLWNNDLLVFSNFFNAIPGSIEAVALTKNKKRNEEIAKIHKQEERNLAECICYTNLNSMKEKLTEIIKINFSDKSLQFKEEFYKTLNDIKSEWVNNKNEWTEIVSRRRIRRKDS